MPHDTRDAVVDYLTDWAEKTELPMAKLLKWAEISKPRFYEWRQRHGNANEHNGKVPRDHWLEPAERNAILDFHAKNSLNGYRRLTFMMLDQDIAAASPATVYRVLKGRWAPESVELEALEKGHRFRSAARSPRALAHRHHVYQHRRNFLLPVHGARRV
ncbi:hypothetical protein ENSA7_81730 [Enhygromyxa salina]|uniref:Uncharacterized protein n=1 Tax=Enhygromyxa salina TaxID=215803 RepID=A0A2S9XH10_9BACT|nr:hypothetical protein [Enhygromyxa salina]PRP92117.1 hypothetical protein ENSA7_81730 [Enhygromyxa salina]